jgi:hypothetical protein
MATRRRLRRKAAKKLDWSDLKYECGWNETKACEGGLGSSQFVSEMKTFKTHNPKVRVRSAVEHSPYVGDTQLVVYSPTKRELNKALRHLRKNTGYQGFRSGDVERRHLW